MRARTSRPKMSEALKRLAQMNLRNPNTVPSSEAAHAALLFAHVGWNAALGHDVDGYQKILRRFIDSRPQLWFELQSSDPQVLIDAARQAKLRLYPGDRRIVLVCGIPNDRVHVEWCEEQDYPEAVQALKKTMGSGPGARGGARSRHDARGRDA